MKQVPVYILAGGRSSRFGSDKARAVCSGQPLIRHVAGFFEPIARSVTAVADQADKYNDLGLRTIVDIERGMGPLAGLDAALHDLPAGQEWLMLSCCDAVSMERHWLAALLEASERPFWAVAFRGKHWQPMPALYHRSSRALVIQGLRSGQRSMQRLLDRLPTRSLPQPSDWPDEWQANTPYKLTKYNTRRQHMK